jgi:hypothetical protein
LAFERSKSDVVHDRDVVRERRIEDVDGGLLISEEAVDLRLGERPIGIEVVVDRDLHGVSSLIGAAARATRIAGFRRMVSHRTLSECDVHHIFLAIPFLNLKTGCSTSIQVAHLADMAARRPSRMLRRYQQRLL